MIVQVGPRADLCLAHLEDWGTQNCPDHGHLGKRAHLDSKSSVVDLHSGSSSSTGLFGLGALADAGSGVPGVLGAKLLLLHLTEIEVSSPSPSI